MTMQEPLLRPDTVPGPSPTRLGENTIALAKRLSLWYNETTFEIRGQSAKTPAPPP